PHWHLLACIVVTVHATQSMDVRRALTYDQRRQQTATVLRRSCSAALVARGPFRVIVEHPWLRRSPNASKQVPIRRRLVVGCKPRRNPRASWGESNRPRRDAPARAIFVGWHQLLRVDKPEGHAVRGARHTKTTASARQDRTKATGKGSRSRDLGGGTDL